LAVYYKGAEAEADKGMSGRCANERPSEGTGSRPSIAHCLHCPTFMI
jgi:hypothetical protein